MSQPRYRGFTLIELLVVIAIIGILSAVILASLSTARSKGQQAAIQSDLSTVQTEAEIYYNGSGANTYGSTESANCSAGMFSADTTIGNALKGITSNNGVATCYSTGSAYAVSASFSGSNFCVDNQGFSGTTSAAISSAACGSNF